MKSILIKIQEKRARKKLERQAVEYKARFESIKHLMSNDLTVQQQINLFGEIKEAFKMKLNIELRMKSQDIKDIGHFLKSEI